METLNKAWDWFFQAIVQSGVDESVKRYGPGIILCIFLLLVFVKVGFRLIKLHWRKDVEPDIGNATNEGRKILPSFPQSTPKEQKEQKLHIKEDPLKTKNTSRKKLGLLAVIIVLLCCLLLWFFTSRKPVPNESEDTGATTQTVVEIPEDIQEGKIYKLGSYHFFSDGGRRAIEWIVLKIDLDNNNLEKSKVLMVSRYGLDSIPYGKEDKPITWADSEIHKVLNGSFWTDSFSEEEKECVIPVDNISWDNEDKEDYVFLLSKDEYLENFLGNDKIHPDYRGANPTYYVFYNDENDSIKENKLGQSWWWLRTTFEAKDKKAYIVSDTGDVFVNGDTKGDPIGKRYATPGGLVRPAIWVKINSPCFFSES